LRASWTFDLRSNIAAEARAKIVYERLINFCDDADTEDALQPHGCVARECWTEGQDNRNCSQADESAGQESRKV